MTHSKRDANESALVELWRGLGCLWVPMARWAGFDGLLICPRTGVHVVEIKSPCKKWKLTPAEYEQRKRIEAAGQCYNVITSTEEALALVGAE